MTLLGAGASRGGRHLARRHRDRRRATPRRQRPRRGHRDAAADAPRRRCRADGRRDAQVLPRLGTRAQRRGSVEVVPARTVDRGDLVEVEVERRAGQRRSRATSSTTTMRMIQECLGDTPPDLSQDVSARGMTLVGGEANFTDIDELVATSTGRRGERSEERRPRRHPGPAGLSRGDGLAARPLSKRRSLIGFVATELVDRRANLPVTVFARRARVPPRRRDPRSSRAPRWHVAARAACPRARPGSSDAPVVADRAEGGDADSRHRASS